MKSYTTEELANACIKEEGVLARRHNLFPTGQTVLLQAVLLESAKELKRLSALVKEFEEKEARAVFYGK